MRRRRFGNTGLEIPELVLGGGVVGGILVLADDDTRRLALERAVAAGIDWIDTAAAYGNGISEETIGRHLPKLSPRPRISTKFRLAEDDLSDVPGAVRRHLEGSLRRLGVDSVELFQLHNQLGEADGPRRLATDHVLRSGGIADTLDRLRQEGLIGAAGFTALGETSACLEVIRSARFASAQVYYNLLNPSAAWQQAPATWSAQDFSGLIDACEREGMAMMGIRALAAGVLASDTRHGREVVIASGSDVDRDADRAAAVRQVLGENYGNPARTALRFALAEPRLSCIVVGIAELAHLDEALAAAESGPLPAEALDRLKPLWHGDFDA